MDCKHISRHLDDEGSECARQIAFADRILFNKIDLVSEDELLDVEARCTRVNTTAVMTSKLPSFD